VREKYDKLSTAVAAPLSEVNIGRRILAIYAVQGSALFKGYIIPRENGKA
jgi:hypothetical protein